MEIEGEKEGNEQIEHAMAAAVSEIEAIDPLSLEEAKQRPNWPKWDIAIQEGHAKESQYMEHHWKT